MTKLPSATYITTTDALESLVASLCNEPLLAVDTESNSLHAYQERVCLIQLSSRTADFIIDPLVIENLQPLGKLLENPQIEKIFHAAEYDLMCLKRDFDFNLVNLFDTMTAARICGYKQVGLNNLLSLYLGVEVDKSHQRDNWGKRPLAADSLRYAQMDTHYLPTLRDILYEELSQRDHWEEAQETFTALCIGTPSHDGRNFDPEGYWKIGLPNQLNSTEMGILRELYLLREDAARKHDMPPFKIFSNNTLVEIARAMPHSQGDLVGIIGMTPAQIRRYGKQILNAVYRGRGARLPEPPHHRPPPTDISDRYMALHLWRKEKALRRGVESDVIISKQILWDIAEKAPTTLDELRSVYGLGPWRLANYGQEILQILAQNMH